MALPTKKHARNQACVIPEGFTGIIYINWHFHMQDNRRNFTGLFLSKPTRWVQPQMVWVCFLFAVLSLQFSSDSPARHSVFVKEHRVRAEKSSGRPLDRTLFVLDIPPYCSEVGFFKVLLSSEKQLVPHLSAMFVFQAVLKDLFSRFGSVRSVELRDHPGSSEESGPKLSRFFRPAGKQVQLQFTV